MRCLMMDGKEYPVLQGEKYRVHGDPMELVEAMNMPRSPKDIASRECITTHYRYRLKSEGVARVFIDSGYRFIPRYARGGLLEDEYGGSRRETSLIASEMIELVRFEGDAFHAVPFDLADAMVGAMQEYYKARGRVMRPGSMNLPRILRAGLNMTDGLIEFEGSSIDLWMEARYGIPLSDPSHYDRVRDAIRGKSLGPLYDDYKGCIEGLGCFTPLGPKRFLRFLTLNFGMSRQDMVSLGVDANWEGCPLWDSDVLEFMFGEEMREMYRDRFGTLEGYDSATAPNIFEIDVRKKFRLIPAEMFAKLFADASKRMREGE